MEKQHVEIHIEKVGAHGARWLRSRHASWFLAAISFAESVFAPILIDPFLVAMILAKREYWVRYTVVAIVFSILGGLCAYMLGALFFEVIGQKIIEVFRFQTQFDSIAQSLSQNGFVFVLIGALTPIPYKLVAIASGLVHVDLVTFIFASVFGRIIRLGLVGFAAYAVGPVALPMFRQHLLKFAYVFAVVLIGYIIFKLI